MAVDVGKPPLFFRIEIEASRGLWRVCSGRITSRLIPPTHKHLPKLTPHKFFLRDTKLVGNFSVLKRIADWALAKPRKGDSPSMEARPCGTPHKFFAEHKVGSNILFCQSEKVCFWIFYNFESGGNRRSRFVFTLNQSKVVLALANLRRCPICKKRGHWTKFNPRPFREIKKL